MLWLPSCRRNSAIAVLTFLRLGKGKNISRSHASMTATWKVTKNTGWAQRCGAACTAALTKWSIQVQPHAPNIQTTQRAVCWHCVSHSQFLVTKKDLLVTSKPVQWLLLATTVIDRSHCSQQWHITVTGSTDTKVPNLFDFYLCCDTHTHKRKSLYTCMLPRWRSLLHYTRSHVFMPMMCQWG